MRELIGDLLDVARIATGTLPINPEPVEVASLVDRARNTFLSGGGRHTLDFDLSLDLPPVMADRQRIVQVLSNLLSNAARHSRESSVIRVTAVREDFHVAVTVADEGTGIAAERLPHLFRKFSRIHNEAGEREISGSGLGLAICKGIVGDARGAASGRRAMGWAKGRGLPSPYRRSKRPGAKQQPRPLGAPPARGSKKARRSAFWWWTTTRKHCGSSGTPSRRRASRQ